MSDAWRKLLVVSLACYLIILAVALLTAILSFSNMDSLPEFQREWIIMRTIADFLAMAPVAQAWAVAVTYALIVPMQTQLPGGTSFERFSSPMIVLLVMTLLFSLAYGIAHPRVVNRRASIEDASLVAESLMESVEAATQTQDYQRALEDLDQYIVIVGATDELKEQRSGLLHKALMDAAKTGQSSAAEAAARDSAASAEELSVRARVAHDEEDYSTAHYLATLALALDPGNDEAAQISADSVRRMEQLLPDNAESEQAELYRSILAAKQSLDRGEVIRAYQQLSALAESHPANSDVKRYLALAAESASRLSVSVDEVTSALQLPGTTHFAFVNAEGPESTEIVSIGKLVGTPFGMYAHNVEVMRFNGDGRPVYHVSSDYAKLVEDSLVLTVIDPDHPAQTLEPTVHHADASGGAGSIVKLAPTAHDLWLLGVASADPARASVSDLLRTVRALPKFGVISEPVEGELLFRLSLPFVFLIMCTLTLGFSWRYRSRYLSRPPLLSFVVVPLTPFALLPVYFLLRYAHRVLFSALLLWTGLAVAIVVLVVVEAILLAASLMYLALSSRE